MKKSLIFKILYLFLILIVVAGASVFATNTYLASQVKYMDSNVEESLNYLYENMGAKIITSNANTNNGTTIEVEIGSIIIVSAPASSQATNTETLIKSLQGGEYNGIRYVDMCV